MPWVPGGVSTVIKGAKGTKKAYNTLTKSKKVVNNTNNIKIDISDERFKIQRCGKEFEDYKRWDEIRNEAIAYRL